MSDVESLRRQARELALRHDVLASRRSACRLRREFAADVVRLRKHIDVLRQTDAACSQPAEEWLLDNAEFVEEQILAVRDALSDDLLRQLPVLRGTGELRVMSLCEHYLVASDGLVDEKTWFSWLDAYQEASVLSLAETWALPFVMRAALVRRLADLAANVRERREICAQVDRILASVGTPPRPESLSRALEEAGVAVPLSAPWVVHLVGHLRERMEDAEELRAWLRCETETFMLPKADGCEHADPLRNIMTYEYQLQAGFQTTAANLIGSLRLLERQDWREWFERCSVVERLLRTEAADTYARLDFESRDVLRRRVERLARRLRVPETLVAQKAVELAKRETPDALRPDELPRSAFVSYYLLEPAGVRLLKQALRACWRTRRLTGVGRWNRSCRTYFGVLAAVFGLFWIGAARLINGGAVWTPGEWAVALLALALPASEWAVTTVHGAIKRCFRPMPLLRYDFSEGVPPEATTMVVIPVIWSSADDVRETAERLELHHLATRDANVHYAMLGDFADAEAETEPKDAAIVEAARQAVEELNRKYAAPGGSTFHLFLRKRTWNPKENVWMGWERKRGKLVEFVELLRGKTDTGFVWTIGDASVWPRVRYVITLDADTELPMGAARRMIGAMHLPFNRPRLNPSQTRVVEGYGVLQPRVSVRYESVTRTRLVRFWTGDPGVDAYAFAVSDPYQDGFAEGMFAGKGIFDVDAFARVLCDRIPENRVLSHDLLEGGFLRAGLLSDVELVDEHPATFYAYQRRLHRWVRGDWQLVYWLAPRTADRYGRRRRVDLGALTRWQIVDNLRRSLVAPSLYALVLFGTAGLPGTTAAWWAAAVATALLPGWRMLAAFGSRHFHLRRLWTAFGQGIIQAAVLPFQTALMADAVGRTLYRMTVSRRRLLEWVCSAEVERRSKNGKPPVVMMRTAGYVLAALPAAAGLLTDSPATAAAFAVSLLWSAAPLGIRWLERPVGEENIPLTAEERQWLERLARQIWTFFERFVGEEDHWLVPDNVQVDPPNGVAHRTSPTNVGLQLACVLAARDFGWIGTPDLIEYLDKTISTVEKLEKWNGHLYNWYDTTTLRPLSPPYVSTVDSGNFVVCLIAVKEGLKEWLEADAAGLNESVAERGRSLVKRMEAIVAATDFRPLYDRKARLFSLGFRSDVNERDSVLYDLLASEARQASFAAIALGQIPPEHWRVLGRTMAPAGGTPTLLSWSGTMFEYLMPTLFMRHYRDSLLDYACRGAVRRQIAYARRRGVPFGISESAYYAFDFRMNYQYRAFGVPELGFKRGLEHDLVVAPYATILALPYAPRAAVESLRRLEAIGARGEFGFYDAVDFTPDRLPDRASCAVVRTFMAHHQGMSLLALANLLSPYRLPDRFHRDTRVRAAELLLKERMPDRPALLQRQLEENELPPERRAASTEMPVRVFETPHTPLPEVCVLSGGAYTVVVTASGSGFSRFEGLAVTRWRGDPTADDWGSFFYIRDVATGAVWSPTFQPCRTEIDDFRAEFSPACAVFTGVAHGVRSRLDICVSPDVQAEVRRLTLANVGTEPRELEVTTYQEIVLASPAAESAHPAFAKLFVETMFDVEHECLLARRRPRTPEEPPVWAVHALSVESDEAAGAVSAESGPAEFETDRIRFIGRGCPPACPQGVRGPLSGSVGAVADPAFVMRRRVVVPPGGRVVLVAVTGVSDAREKAVDIVRRLKGAAQVERAFRSARARSQLERSHFRLNASETEALEQLGGRLLYRAPYDADRVKRVAELERDISALWAYGISGDLPIVAVRVSDSAGLPAVARWAAGREYLVRKGIGFDLAVLVESRSGYQRAVQDAVMRIAERYSAADKASGRMYVLEAERMPPETKNLLLAAAGVVLCAEGPSLRAQLRVRPPADVLPAPLVPSADAREPSAVARPEDGESASLVFFNGIGGFTPDGREYRILMDRARGRSPRLPWINAVSNPTFGFLVSETYTGCTWWLNSREFRLTPWSNDPATDRPGEMIYVRDEESGRFWTVAPFDASYVVSHGQGYSRFRFTKEGVEHDLVVYAAGEDAVKIAHLRLADRSGRRRVLTVTAYAEWVLGTERDKCAPFLSTEWDRTVEALLARNGAAAEPFRGATAFLAVRVQPSGDPESSGTRAEAAPSWTGDRGEFIGRGGSVFEPAALGRVRLSGRIGPTNDPCGAVQVVVQLEAKGERSVFVLLGCGASREEAVRLAQKYRSSDACVREFEEAVSFWDDLAGAVEIRTPSAETDLLLNRWLPYQVLSCRMWGRAGFYQAGGAYGFRDQLQDSLALLHARPDLTRRQILLHASRQYEEGDVQHWWHEETDRGIRTRFSDDLLWLPYAAARYVEHTGDERLLDETAPFLKSEPLGPSEEERYERAAEGDVGTVYEHCVRAIERALRFGEHGLPLIGTGDWNDGMNRVGPEGRGESVWLGWFLCDVLERFSDICERRGDRARAVRYRQARASLAKALNDHAWDGKWYRRARTDDGVWLGTAGSSECRIDAIAQSWAVLSKAAPRERAERAMRSADELLVDRRIGVLPLLAPPFDRTEPAPGYIQGYPPGIRENGAQYTHGAVWGVIAWCMLGDGDKAFEWFRMLNPIVHAATPEGAFRYGGEPYVMAGDVYTAEPLRGRSGWTWYTGAASWMWQAGVEWILGLRRLGNRLYFRPCVPSSWPGFSVQYRYGRSRYRITVRNPHGKCVGWTRLTADGTTVDVSSWKDASGPWIELVDDGRVHEVELTM